MARRSLHDCGTVAIRLVSGRAGDGDYSFRAIRSVVHRNLFLISACYADEAYQKAQQLGSRGEQSYQNPDGQRVEHRFRGVAKLDGVVDGTLEDGSELGFTEHIGILEEQIGQWICSKEKLGAFLQSDASRKFDPDCRSGEVMRQLARCPR